MAVTIEQPAELDRLLWPSKSWLEVLKEAAVATSLLVPLTLIFAEVSYISGRSVLEILLGLLLPIWTCCFVFFFLARSCGMITAKANRKLEINDKGIRSDGLNIPWKRIREFKFDPIGQENNLVRFYIETGNKKGPRRQYVLSTDQQFLLQRELKARQASSLQFIIKKFEKPLRLPKIKLSMVVIWLAMFGLVLSMNAYVLMDALYGKPPRNNRPMPPGAVQFMKTHLWNRTMEERRRILTKLLICSAAGSIGCLLPSLLIIHRAKKRFKTEAKIAEQDAGLTII